MLLICSNRQDAKRYITDHMGELAREPVYIITEYQKLLGYKDTEAIALFGRDPIVGWADMLSYIEQHNINLTEVDL